MGNSFELLATHIAPLTDTNSATVLSENNKHVDGSSDRVKTSWALNCKMRGW